jgi:hypothetical protein
MGAESNPSFARGLGVIMAAALLTGATFALVDTAVRSGEPRLDLVNHGQAALQMYLAAAVLLGAMAWLVVALETALHDRLARHRPRTALALRLAGFAALAVWALRPIARATFEEASIRPALALWGPRIVLAVAALAAALLAAVVAHAARAAACGRRPWPCGVGLGLLILGGAVSYVDLTFFVALYGRLHAVLEMVAAVAFCTGLALLLRLVERRWSRAGMLWASIGVALGGWSAAYIDSDTLRLSIEDELRDALVEPVYAGRMLQRTQLAAAYLEDPAAWRGSAAARMNKLHQRYDIATTSQSPVWSAPNPEPETTAEAIALTRGEQRPSIVVFYVDTLRYDVAHDPGLMPNVTRFAESALDFQRVYAAASDTVGSLPAMTGGRFDLARKKPYVPLVAPDEALRDNDVLRLAERAKVHSQLFIPKSANSWLRKEHPEFRFADTVELPDYEPGKKKVWGYGADRPSAERVVDAMLAWLEKRRTAGSEERFLAWAFQFDVHAWRELDEGYLKQASAHFGIEDDGSKRWRYHVAARAVDEAFGKLLDGLERLRMSDDTVVVFAADHGEALGRQGFWVHSTFMWEALMRVPLLLRVPGVPARAVDDYVSLADFAPTVARFLDPNAPVSGYHGEDLLGRVVPDPVPRRLPILMVSSTKDKLRRLGAIAAKRPYKLVLDLDLSLAQLHDLRKEEPDDWDVAPDHRLRTLELLSHVVRSPLFPREEATGPRGHRGKPARRRVTRR